MKYSVLPPESLEVVYENVKKYLPDFLRSPQAFALLYGASDSMFFEIGLLGGAFWLANICIGWKATIHTVLWDKEVREECLHKVTFPRKVIHDIFELLRLQRLEAFVPAAKETTCEYAERLGFSLEGVLRKSGRYDGELVDVAVYSILKEDM